MYEEVEPLMKRFFLKVKGRPGLSEVVVKDIDDSEL